MAAMNISGTAYRTLWPLASGAVRVIDQSRLPFEFETLDLATLEDAAQAIRTMVVRGAPLEPPSSARPAPGRRTRAHRRPY